MVYSRRKGSISVAATFLFTATVYCNTVYVYLTLSSTKMGRDEQCRYKIQRNENGIEMFDLCVTER